jgi:hypothetical protein
MLGLATTEQLLVELQARGETTRYGDESLEADGDALARAAAMLLATLPPKMLAYRTWGAHR